MDFIPLVNIEVAADRNRKTFSEEDQRDLESSIMERGLLHPIGVEKMVGGYDLRFGERRLRAMTVLHHRDIQFFHGSQIVPNGMIPCTVLSDLSPVERRRIELDENMRRVDLTWQERVEALNDIATLLKEIDPNISQAGVYAKIADTTDQSIHRVAKTVQQAEVIKTHMNVPAVASARNFQEAYKAASYHRERSFAAELSRRDIATAKAEGDERIEMRRGDLFKELPNMTPGLVDLLICDPPYGYDADTTFGQKVETKHLYRDDEEYAKEVYKLIIKEGFRVTKPLAHLVLFCKPTLFSWLAEQASMMAWTPFMRPIIWKKNPGYAPWGNRGFRYNYEMLFWAVKGQRGLNYLMEDIIEVPPLKEKTHGAEKPIDLMTKLIEAMTETNNYVLDPCMGTGASMIAARRLHRKGLGIELSEDYFSTAMARLVDERNTDEQLAGEK